MKKYIIALACLTGCAAQQRSLAYDGAQAAKEIANVSASSWEAQVAARVDECRKTVPKESSTKAEREECLGIYNETDKAVKIFEAIVHAQRAVYWALKFGEMKDVRDALKHLDEIMQDAKPFLDAAMERAKL